MAIVLTAEWCDHTIMYRVFWSLLHLFRNLLLHLYRSQFSRRCDSHFLKGIVSQDVYNSPRLKKAHIASNVGTRHLTRQLHNRVGISFSASQDICQTVEGAKHCLLHTVHEYIAYVTSWVNTYFTLLMKCRHSLTSPFTRRSRCYYRCSLCTNVREKGK